VAESLGYDEPYRERFPACSGQTPHALDPSGGSLEPGRARLPRPGRPRLGVSRSHQDGYGYLAGCRQPDHAWQIAIDHSGEVRERRADDACGNGQCAHAACWIEKAHVTELSGLLREGPDGDQLKGWPKTMRVFARRERPHPGAQLTLFEAEDGWRYSLWATNRPAGTKGWLGQNAYLDAAHRIQARVEDVPHQQGHRPGPL